MFFSLLYALLIHSPHFAHFIFKEILFALCLSEMHLSVEYLAAGVVIATDNELNL
jgi:hypothetical protein